MRVPWFFSDYVVKRSESLKALYKFPIVIINCLKPLATNKYAFLEIFLPRAISRKG